ncbi:hypothetical protein MTR_2g083410 [Medicago truncatula]|uniref:Uncharacterized protein n=1 Tax=Medicago truncatula TaxID=3880 RepID=G7IJQ0_MEDTR|nr:hypothetical protein MTR_2g083410 [Medicago truncatula]
MYPFSDISTATNNFSANCLSSNSFRCCLHNRDIVVFQRNSAIKLTSLSFVIDLLLSAGATIAVL